MHATENWVDVQPLASVQTLSVCWTCYSNFVQTHPTTIYFSSSSSPFLLQNTPTSSEVKSGRRVTLEPLRIQRHQSLDLRAFQKIMTILTTWVSPVRIYRIYNPSPFFGGWGAATSKRPMTYAFTYKENLFLLITLLLLPYPSRYLSQPRGPNYSLEAQMSALKLKSPPQPII